MVIQLKLEPAAFWICALGITAGALLLPVVWNKKKLAGFLQSWTETLKTLKKE